MTGGNSRPLLVAGVAGGVGTSTWTRAFRRTVALPVEDIGRYVGRLVDVLVTSNTAAATAQLGNALKLCPRPPLLVVMHTVPGSIGTVRAHLRKAQPHITRQFDVAHQRVWLELDEPPGSYLPRGFTELVRAIPAALQEMYRGPEKSAPADSSTRDVRMGAPVTYNRPREPGTASWPPDGHVSHSRRSQGG